MKNEQELVTKTEMHFDFIDRVKILFGRIPVIEVKVIIPVKVEMYNAVSEIKFIKGSKMKFTKDKPDYGYSPMG